MNNKNICIVGLGGGGCKIIDQIQESVQNAPAVVAVNTDSSALENSRATTKLQIGLSRT